MEKKKQFFSRFPDALVLLILLILISVLLTYIIPAGEFNRIQDPNTGREVVEAGTFHNIEQTPVGLGDLFIVVPNGMATASTVIFFLLLIGGAFGVINGTGALESLTASTISKSKGGKSGPYIIAALILFFGFVSAVVGMFGECLVFIPVVVMLMISLGYDALVGTAIVMASICAGYGASTLNPFNVQIAQGIAGIPILSGMWFRWIVWAVIMMVLIWYILRYSEKVKKNPEASLVKDIDYSDLTVPEGEEYTLTSRRKLVLGIFFGSIFLLIFLMIKLSFTLPQIASYFLLVGVISGIVYGMHVNDIVNHFVKGSKTMVYAALLVGFASAISIVLAKGKILDTIIYSMSVPLQYLPKTLAAGLMVVVQSIINFFIPSGSGQAMAVMPIVAPLADVLGFSRQVSVLAFQMGDGFANLIVPTLGILMAGIGMGRVPFTTWIKFIYKLFLLFVGIGIAFVMIAVVIGLT